MSLYLLSWYLLKQKVDWTDETKVLDFLVYLNNYILNGDFVSVYYDVSLDVHIHVFLRLHNMHVVLYDQIHMIHAKCAFFLLRFQKYL